MRFTPYSLGLALLAHQALAQTPADSSRNLNPVVVTATRSETRLDRIPQTLKLINRADLDLTPANDLTDLVKKTAGVQVIQYPNLSSGVGIRGFRPQFSGLNQRTLLLIDGRPAGATNLSTIQLSAIDHIEVLKGPASALYGSQAMGGVINVITRRSKGTPTGNAFAEYGSFQTLQAGFSSGGNLTSKLDYDLSFAYFERGKDYKIGKDNWLRNAFGFKNAVKYYAKGTSEEVDDRRDDGQTRPYTQLQYYSGALRLGYQIAENWRVDVRGERFQARNVQSPGDIAYGITEASSKDVERASLEASLTGQIGAHQPSLKVFTADEANNNYTLNASGKPVIPYRSNRTANAWSGLQVKDVWKLGQHSLVLGYDYTNASTQGRRWSDATTERAPTQPDYALISSAFYAQATLNVDKLTIQPGLRWDQITFDVKQTPLLTSYRAGKKTNPFLSPNLGVTYQLPQHLRIKATVGRAFVTPDAYNVAGYSEARTTAGKIAVTSGNPDLANESSWSWDVGVDYQHQGFYANATYFSTQVKNRIARVVRTVNEPFGNGDVIVSRTTFINAADSDINGLEAEAGYDFGYNQKHALRLFGNLTTMFKAQEVIVGTDESRTERMIANVAKTNVNYGLEFDNRKNLRLRLTGRYVGTRRDIDYTDALNPEIEYTPFMVVDLVAAYTLEKKHTLTLLLNNLTDENYYEKRGYNMPGRSVSLRYALQF
ncbi:TonB-dependent receptor [Siphonobacter sp. SORGH_AS_0500]|uniref:TonB-dependent receptor plug domain-containing protein n=1 Tax=Siphonobacter sp. SORGH_AS_0500 TaxID=1864824 RepID=UPI002858B2C6|nr:TonB-dependent receptor [Siphonobacter sp. SORGH_AS_0500]MDR6198018.1 vitamin B12 transporter [Siphonobacter sp. SORGH_AS_0500]